MTLASTLSYRGHVLRPEFVEETRGVGLDQSWLNKARNDLRRKGFVLLRNALPIELVAGACERVISALEEFGEVVRDGRYVRATGISRRNEMDVEPGESWSAVTRTGEILDLAHGKHLETLIAGLMGESVHAERAIYVRCVGRGGGSSIHTDFPPIDPPPTNTLKAWVALSRVDPLVSGLFLLEMGGTLDFLHERNAAAAAKFRKISEGGLLADPNDWLASNNLKLWTACLEPGDVFVFDVFCPHGSFDNTGEDRRVRISCDVGWQGESAACSRQIGPPPIEAKAYARFIGAPPLVD